jgi:hypothetical protein
MADGPFPTQSRSDDSEHAGDSRCQQTAHRALKRLFARSFPTACPPCACLRRVTTPAANVVPDSLPRRRAHKAICTRRDLVGEIIQPSGRVFEVAFRNDCVPVVDRISFVAGQLLSNGARNASLFQPTNGGSAEVVNMATGNSLCVARIESERTPAWLAAWRGCPDGLNKPTRRLTHGATLASGLRYRHRSLRVGPTGSRPKHHFRRLAASRIGDAARPSEGTRSIVLTRSAWVRPRELPACLC